jgi:Non-repetitive/WGA-negative nucleoporin C-terminal
VAFQLAVHHDYYEGICQMALDHESKEDAESFRLTSLLKSTDVCQSMDFHTGSTFGQFVLSWFTDRGLYGHTLMYGRLCPERDLNHILQSDERLRPYRWIQAVHKGDYSGAASSLMTTKDAKSTEATLAKTKWSFCMAKLSNHVVLKESQSQRKEAEQREATINKTLELIGVQNVLAPQTEHLFTANRLLSQALDQADQAMKEGIKNQIEDSVKSCYLGLIVCTTFDDKVDQRRQAAQLWAKR